MIDWNLSDEQMRECVVKCLASNRDVMAFQADREERALKDGTVSPRGRSEAEACARYSRRQAAHYQQAIDALIVLPMPKRSSDEPND